MPHVTTNAKEKLADGGPIMNPGNLNFLLSMLVKRYWQNSPRNYQSINDCIGALEGAKLEFYRLIAVPYEERKIIENGNAYDGDNHE